MANTLNLGTDGNWATKEDLLLGYNSENNNYKPLPFDFTRNTVATRVNKDGLIETVGSGQPRIDFKDDSKGALLLEPSRSNLVLTSASGTYGNNPASEANTTSPDGTNNAVIPTPDAVADRYQYDVSSGTYATDTKLSYSWYRKRISTPITTSYIGDLQMNNLANVTQVGSTTQIQSDVNGFDRFQAVFNITDGSASSIVRGYFGTVVGIGNSSVAYFGHQLEQGSYATSYIPTQGGVVTREAEDIALTLPDNASFNSSNGFSIISKFGIGNAGSGTSTPFISFNDDTSNTYIGFGSDASNFRCRLNLNGVAYLNTQGNASRTQENSLFVSCDADGWSQGANGVTNDTGNNDASVYDKLSNISYGASELYGIIRIKELSVYSTRLSNTELQALTSN